jgi:hypothetical protein
MRCRRYHAWRESEGARVELEIRIADEEHVARGYATLLAVPGAIASAAEAQDTEGAVRAVIEGRDATVARAQSQFARKRDDLEHDIAALKRAVHERISSWPMRLMKIKSTQERLESMRRERRTINMPC